MPKAAAAVRRREMKPEGVGFSPAERELAACCQCCSQSILTELGMPPDASPAEPEVLVTVTTDDGADTVANALAYDTVVGAIPVELDATAAAPELEMLNWLD
jgi:hypothetical protein